MRYSEVLRSDLADNVVSFAQIFQLADVGLCVVEGDHFVQINPAVARMLGSNPDDMAGTSGRGIFVSERHYREVRFAAVPGEIVECELLTRQDALLWCRISVTPAGVSSSSDDQRIWVVLDVSASKREREELVRSKHALEHMVERRTLNLRRINKELREEIERRRYSERSMIESREKYRALVRTAPVGIMLTEADGAPMEINERGLRLFGVPNLSAFIRMTEHTMAIRLDEQQAEPLTMLLRSQIPATPGKELDTPILWTAPSGEQRWINIVCCEIPIRDMGRAIFFEDRTDEYLAIEKERMQRDALALAGRMTLAGQISTAIAHEVGQPLNACQGYAAGLEHRLRSHMVDDPEIDTALRRMQQHLQQAGDIIRNVRSFVSKRQAGDEVIDLANLLDETLDLLAFRLKNVVLAVSHDTGLGGVFVHANRVELQQVLINLIMNAIEACADLRRQARIRVRIRVMGKNVVISVSDNGRGIDPSVRDRIFDAYVTTKSHGLGMGLMICRTIVESHGGTLTQANLRRGARFDVSLIRAKGNFSNDRTY